MATNKETKMEQIPMPSNAGWIFSHTRTHDIRIFCPMANSKNIKGMPSITMNMKYGIKKAPERIPRNS